MTHAGAEVAKNTRSVTIRINLNSTLSSVFRFYSFILWVK